MDSDMIITVIAVYVDNEDMILLTTVGIWLSR